MQTTKLANLLLSVDNVSQQLALVFMARLYVRLQPICLLLQILPQAHCSWLHMRSAVRITMGQA